MQLTKKRDDVITSGVESKQFKIKADSKAFEILSSNLYSDPMGAVVREISTNAYDAHIDAGIPEKPFDLFVPNKINPVLKFRDYGKGLDQETIENVYTTLFESTKDESNNFVGCLGLGSKTPFGLSENFTVTSYHDGQRSVYSAFLDSQGIPNVALMFQEESDEPSGLEVEVAVKKDDIKWIDPTIRKQLKFFKVKPNIIGNSQFEWDEPEYSVEGENWGLLDNFRSNFMVVQGQIAYPVTIEAKRKIRDKLYDSNNDMLNIIDKPYVAFVGLGDVNIAPSREDLYYDEKTIDNLVEIIKQIQDEVMEQLIKTFKTKKTLHEKITYLHKSLRDIGVGMYQDKILEKYRSEFNAVLDGIDVFDAFEVAFSESKINEIVRYEKNWRSDKYFRDLIHAHITNEKVKKNGEYVRLRKYVLRRSFLDKRSYVFVSDSEQKSVPARTKHWARERGYSCIYVIHTDNYKADDLKKHYFKGFDNVIDVSDIPKLKRKKPKEKNNIHTIFEYTNIVWGSKQDCWDDTELTKEEVEDLDPEKNLWVDLNRWDMFISKKNGSVKVENYSAFSVNIKKILGYDALDGYKILGFRKRTQKIDHGLQELGEFLQEKMNRIDCTYLEIEDIDHKNILAELKKALDKLGDHETHLNDLKESPIGPLLNQVVKRDFGVQSSMRWLECEGYFNFEKRVLTTDETKVIEKYGMLNLMERSPWNQPKRFEVIKNYIQQVDLIESLNSETDTKS